MKGPVLQFPVAFGAITVSYNLPGVKSGLKLDGPTTRRHLQRQDQDLERPGDQGAEPGHEPARARAITVVHRSDSSGTTDGFTTYLSDVEPDLGEVDRRRQGRQVADRHRRGQELRRRRRGQADPGRGRLRRAGLRARERLHLRGGQELGRHLRAADDRQHLGGRERASRSRPTWGSRRSTRRRRAPTRSSPRRSSTPTRTPARRGASQSMAKGLKTFLTYAFGAGQKTLGAELQPAALRARCRPRWRPRTTRSWRS